MARVAATTKEYIQAKKTVGHVFDAEKLIDDSYLDALQIMIDIMNDKEAPATVRISISKFIQESHGKFAKNHGKNPQPKDFITDIVVDVVAEDDNVISMKFKG
jgi:hypothetical protein